MTKSSGLTEKLKTLGLTENECKVYFALLKLGAGTIQQLSREARLQRTEIYPLMTRLVSKGLVEETIDRPKKYAPADVKVALPRLAWNIRDRLDRIAKESEKLATKLQGFSANSDQAMREEVRVIYGPHASREHLLESARSAKGEFWGMAGRRRPPHVSDRLLAEALRLIISNKVKSRFIFEVDRENLKRIGKIAQVAEVRHFEPIPVYMYGSDKTVAVSLVEEPIIRTSQIAQLVSTYRPTAHVMRHFFNLLWAESIPFATREAILRGQRPPAGEESTIIRGRRERYIHSMTAADSTKQMIRAYTSNPYGPARLLEGVGDAFLRARGRGVKIRVICKLSDKNSSTVKALARFAEVRHTENPIGFSMGIADDDAAIYYVEHDSPDLESRTDYTIRVTSKDGIRHLGNLFEALWAEATPMEDAMRKLEAKKGAASNLPA